MSFQVILYEKDNSIKFNYQGGIASGLATNAVGIENRDGSIGLRYRGLSTVKSNINLSVLFSLADPGIPEPEQDGDSDGYTVDDGDCDDTDARINPGATEDCFDGIDNNCNGSIDEGCDNSAPSELDLDSDGDGYTVDGGDCDDSDATINPGAVEDCTDDIDNNCNGETDENCDLSAPTLLYFPLLVESVQETYFGLINNSAILNLSGALQAFNADGELIRVKEGIELGPLARQEFTMAEEFSGLNEDVAYVAFAGDTAGMGSGYCRFVDVETANAAAYPAITPHENSRELYLPTLIYEAGWSTEVGFVGISDLKLKAEMVFNNGATSTIVMQPNGHHKIVVNDSLPVTYNGTTLLLGELPPANAATVKFSHMFATVQDMVVGAVIYRDESRMGAAALSSVSDIELVVPYLVMDDYWWSSLALYNPGSSLRTSGECLLKMSSYGQNEMRAVDEELEGTELNSLEAIQIVANEFPSGTHDLRVENECGVVGMEFIGTSDAMACFTVSKQSSKSGVFARVQIVAENTWSGVVLLNPWQEQAKVTLIAYDDNGHYLGEEEHLINSFGQLEGLPEDLFKNEISQATSIRYVADRELVGLLINNQSIETEGEDVQSRLDILPSLMIETTGSVY